VFEDESNNEKVVIAVEKNIHHSGNEILNETGLDARHAEVETKPKEL